jgi:hypothetical protein
MSGGSTAGARGLALAATTALSTATLFAAAHVRLVNVGSSGPLYKCNTVDCAPARTDDPSRKNLGWMDFYVLPQGCVELAGVTLRPGGLGTDVECGPPGDSRLYRCQSGSCRPFDPATDDGGSIAWPIALPADCGGRIHELVVVNAGTDRPAAFIECDASSGPADEM